jgi:hypothetical protein
VFVVGETNVGANKDTVFYRHTLGDKGKSLDLDVTAKPDLFANLNKGADLAARTDLAAIKIDKIRMVNNSILPQLNIWRYHRDLLVSNKNVNGMERNAAFGFARQIGALYRLNIVKSTGGASVPPVADFCKLKIHHRWFDSLTRPRSPIAQINLDTLDAR